MVALVVVAVDCPSRGDVPTDLGVAHRATPFSLELLLRRTAADVDGGGDLIRRGLSRNGRGRRGRGLQLIITVLTISPA